MTFPLLLSLQRFVIIVYVFNLIQSAIFLVDLMEVYLTALWIESLSPDQDKPKYLGKRNPYGIEVESYSIEEMSGREENAEADNAAFACGNPTVEKIEGIVHFYKEKSQTSLAEDVKRPLELCILNVPIRMCVRDLLSFLAPLLKNLAGLKIIKKQATTNSYMALLRFREHAAADSFFQSYNGREFSSLEPGICQIVYVSKLEFTSGDIRSSTWLLQNGADLTELPTCPVCLERMDESVEGLVTVLCNHDYHTACLEKCQDTTCPVCRSVLSPEFNPESTPCSECGSTTDELWICLICGNVGCGRYEGKHAYQHYEETQHLYAMQVNNGRVWDYAGDNYVHRLIQSKGDGKLVEVPSGGLPGANSNVVPVDEEKMDSVTLEYTFLLTSQLESQRKYFEEKMAILEQMCNEQLQSMAQEFTESKRRVDELSTLYNESKKEKEAIENKYTHLNKILSKLRAEIDEEKALNVSLRSNQSEWALKVQTVEQKLKDEQQSKEKAVKELEEQLRDLFFHLESQQKLEQGGMLSKDEAQSSQLVIPEDTTPSSTPSSKSRRRKSGKSSSNR